MRAALLAAATVGAALLWQRMWSDPALTSPQRLTLACFSAVTVAYLGAMVLSATRTALPPFHDRYLAPVYILLVVVIGSLAAYVLARTNRKRLLQAALLAWSLFPLSRYATVTAAMLRDDSNPLEASFNDRVWRTSATLAWLRTGGGRRLYSNAADAIWFHTGLVARGVPNPNRAKIGRAHV